MSLKTDQGWINHYRKLVLFTGSAFILYVWFFCKPIISIPEPIEDLLEGIGTSLLVIGILGRVFASLTIESHKNERVVDTELYSVVRHPLYFFSFIIVLGIGLLIPNIDVIILLIILYVGCFYPMLINEEKFLERKFGAEYTEYKKRTPRLIPNFSKWKARKTINIDLRLVTRTMLDSSIAFLIFPLVEILEFIKFKILH